MWIYLRHYINWWILYANLTTFRTIGAYELNWETQHYKSWISQVICFGLLASLQAVNLFWLYLIIRIARNYVFKRDWVDERSEAESEDELAVGGDEAAERQARSELRSRVKTGSGSGSGLDVVREKVMNGNSVANGTANGNGNGVKAETKKES